MQYDGYKTLMILLKKGTRVSIGPVNVKIATFSIKTDKDVLFDERELIITRNTIVHIYPLPKPTYKGIPIFGMAWDNDNS